MSANFPSGLSESGVDTTGRATTTVHTTYESAAKQAGTTLRSDLALLKNDLDHLLSRASTLSDRELSEAYARMMTKFSSLRFAAKGMAVEARQQFNQGVDKTSEYVKDRPLQSVALASGFGLVLGLLMRRH